MKFASSLVALGLAVGAISSPAMERRDGGPAISAAIALIAEDIIQFNTDVNAYAGGPPTIIQADSDKIVADTKLAIAAVLATDALAYEDIALLITPIQNLNLTINQAIDDLILKKDLLVEACAGPQVLDDLHQQLDTATTLADSILERVPPELKDIAGQLSAPIIAAINRGIDAFAGVPPCVSTTISSSSSTSTSESSSSSTGETTTTTSDSGPSTTSSTTHGETTATPAPSYPASNSTATDSPYPTTTEGGGEGDDCTTTYVGGPAPTHGGSEPYPTGGEGGSGQPYPTGGHGGEGQQTYPTGGEGHQYPTGGAPPYPTSAPSGTTPPPFTNSAARVSGPIGVILAIAAVVAF